MEYKLKRVRRFDLNQAKEYVWYTLLRSHKTIFGKVKWEPVYYNGTRTALYGDEKWAKAIAKELNIKVPKAEEQ